MALYSNQEPMLSRSRLISREIFVNLPDGILIGIGLKMSVCTFTTIFLVNLKVSWPLVSWLPQSRLMYLAKQKLSEYFRYSSSLAFFAFQIWLLKIHSVFSRCMACSDTNQYITILLWTFSSAFSEGLGPCSRGFSRFISLRQY